MIPVHEAIESDVRDQWNHPLHVLRYIAERGSLAGKAVLWRRYRVRVEGARAAS